MSADTTIQYANPAVADIFGYDSDSLRGDPITVLFPDGQAQEMTDRVEQYLTTPDQTGEWGDIRLQGSHKNGEAVPLSISLSDFTRNGTQYVSGIFRDISAQQQRELRLTELNRLAQELTEAESSPQVCEQTIIAAQTILAQPIVAIELYDADEGRLVPCEWTPEVDEIAADGHLFASDRSIPWNAFVSQEPTQLSDITAETTLEAGDTPLESALIRPIGSYGVFIVGSTQPNGFSETDLETANILVGNTYSAFERVDREESLRKQKDELEEKTETLDRVRRINTVIRDLTKALTQATGRDEITTEVCTRLADADSYRFTWFGSVDPATATVTPEAAAGNGDGFLEEFTITIDEETTDHGLIERAIQTHSPQVQNTVYQNPPFEPWRQAAINRGYRATIAVPVVYQDTLYGVFNLYAAEANVFEQLEVAVLQELGETIGYALNADERKQAFTSDQSVELAFEITEFGDSLFDLTTQLSGTVELRNLVERRDGSVTMFFVAQGQDPDAVLEWARTQPQMNETHLLTDRTDDRLFECTLDESTVWAQLLQRGSIVTDATATADSARIEIRIPRSADPRSYDSLLDEQFADVELVARREYDEPVMTPEEFEAEFRDQLTERQDEVLQTAYYAGYFEWPRETKSSELADVLDIAQPTISRHIRSSEQQFLSMVYDAQSGSDEQSGLE